MVETLNSSSDELSSDSPSEISTSMMNALVLFPYDSPNLFQIAKGIYSKAKDHNIKPINSLARHHEQQDHFDILRCRTMTTLRKFSKNLI